MFRTKETVHLVASLIVLTTAFTYPSLSPERMLTAAFGVGTGFLLHEFAHRFTAHKFGYAAGYEASTTGLLLAIGFSFITQGRIVFAAPGTVVIRSRKKPQSEEVALISASGALMNMVLAGAFFTASLLASTEMAQAFLRTCALINALFAGFNMVPLPYFDGAAVWIYKPSLWVMIVIPSLLLFLITQVS